VFGQATYEVTDDTRLTAGLRYTWESKRVDGLSYRYVAIAGAPGTGVPIYNAYYGTDGLVFGTTPLNSMHLKTSWAKPTWRLALDHDFTPGVMAYVSYSRGFKSGSYTAGDIRPTQTPVNPEVLDAYEIGLKSEWWDHRVRLNLATFYYDYKDIQVSFIGPTVVQLQNAGAARLYGVDLDFAVAATRALTIRGGLSSNDSKYTEFPNAQTFLPNVKGVVCPAAAQAVTLAQARVIASGVPTGGNCAYKVDAAGADLIYAPNLTANVAADYNWELSGGGKVVLSGALYHNSGYDTSAGGIFSHVKAYEELTASLTWYSSNGRYYVRASGANLTDDIHPITNFAFASNFQEISSRPRSYLLTLGMKMGGR
jgi:iron complex outermembrane receptor protein